MSILKRFILIEWFRAFFTATIGLFVIMSVADLITGFLRSNVSAIEVLYNFVFNVPHFLSRTLPIGCLMATLFSLNKLKAHSELIAILAAGFSAKVIITLIFLSSLLVSIGQFYLLAYIVPTSKVWRHSFTDDKLKGKFRESKEKGLKTSSLATGLIWYKSQNYYVSFSAFNKKTFEIINPTLYYFNPHYKGEMILKAPIMTYLGQHQWKMLNASEFSSLDQLNHPAYLNHKEKVLTLDEEAQDFDQIESDIETLNVMGLSRFIAQIKNSGINIKEYEVIFYEMFSMSLICLVFGLFPASSVFEPNRRNSSFGKSVIFTLVFTVSYFVVYSAAVALGTTNILPVSIAVFLIPALTLLYNQFIFIKHRKL